MTVKTLHMGAAKVALDLGDGSERGEYVGQDYILKTLGRPHRAVNLMYCYYPLDQGWPARASTLPLPGGGKAGFAWDYAYDDYFPYQGGAGGDIAGEPFGQMRDVRRHGQDVILTLTVDCAVPDSHLIQIAEELRPFGRLMLRINHEATGNWFAFNKRYTYQQVADFYVRFHNILKTRAPHIRTILCIGEDHPDENGKMAYEDEFAEAIAAADIWSTDTYLALHWGWPYDIAEPGGTSHKRSGNGETLSGFLYEYSRFLARSGAQDRPFVISEFNADGDVTGAAGQAAQLADLYRRLPEEAPCITGITFYQFRDRGRLGLEIEDPGNPDIGHAQPVLEEYKKILNMPPYLPAMTEGAETAFPAKLRWGGSEDADGLSFPLTLENDPVFCEVTFPGEDERLNLMLELNGRWFYKKSGVKTIDLMPAFFNGGAPRETALRLFAPPPDGVNDPAQGDGWEMNYFTEIKTVPVFRIRYTPAAEPKE
ncbi:MAG: hypothetical protein LBR76_01020 [Oscillospiraceae bacterium]|jgi:hypothetical protein|nr:hypothetical protein [Oscillospiraceae bacterium]